MTTHNEELRAIELLRQLTEQLSSAADLHTALHSTLAAAMKVCSAQRGVVHLLRDDKLQIVATREFDHVAMNTLEDLLARHDGTPQRAARESSVIVAEDFAQSDLSEAPLAAQLRYRAALSIPLVEADSLLAVFTLYFGEPHRSQQRELSWIETYARQAAHVLRRSQAESALAASERRFRSIFQESNDFIVTADLHQKITYCNPATAAALGWPTEDIVGHSIAEFIPNPHFDRTSTMLDQKLREGGSTRYEVDVIARDGRRMTWEINSRLTFGPDGKPTGLHAIGRDVTTMRAAHEALRTSERALREADQRKDEFLAMLAHELRNPLAPIRTAAQVLKQSAASPNQLQQASQIVERQVQHITRIVDDLLDVSRVTRGLVTLNRQPTSLHEVVRMAAEQVRPLIEAKHHGLNISLPNEPVTLSGEAVRLVQMIANLLSNAARHS
ncbi:MAG TPA: PAS domain S-box protein, partial [Steroidobacteraceae bacterium]|nr:PAS domain S-box protein [Steroidobacteraceae bacterium]